MTSIHCHNVRAVPRAVGTRSRRRAISAARPRRNRWNPPRPQATVQAPAQHGFDQYAIGAAAANVLWVPVKAAVCGISAGAGAMAFVLSLGACAGGPSQRSARGVSRSGF